MKTFVCPKCEALVVSEVKHSEDDKTVTFSCGSMFQNTGGVKSFTYVCKEKKDLREPYREPIRTPYNDD